MMEKALPAPFLAARAVERYGTGEATYPAARAALLAQAARVRGTPDHARIRRLMAELRAAQAQQQARTQEVELAQRAALPTPPRRAAPTPPSPPRPAARPKPAWDYPRDLPAPVALLAETEISRPPPRLVIAPTREAAQRQYWRHVANRACLAILADARRARLRVPQRSHTTRGADQPPPVPEGDDTYRVRVEPLHLQLPGQLIQTDWLTLDVLVRPQNPANWLTLQTLLDWPTPKTDDPLFKYRSNMQIFGRREGLAGDVVYLFEVLLAPHARALLDAMGLDFAPQARENPYDPESVSQAHPGP